MGKNNFKLLNSFKKKLSRIVLFAVLLSFFTSIKCFSRGEDIIAYWNFDEGKGTVVKDNSGNGHNGKIKGDSIKWVEGKKGKALYFPKSLKKYQDFLIVPNAPELNLNPPFTIEAWIKPDVKAKWQSILQKTIEAGPERNTGWRFWDYYRGLNFTCWNSTENINPKPTALNIVSSLTFQHVVIVCNDKLIKLYINGAEVKKIETTESIKIKPNRLPLTIGSYASGYSYFFEGCIDEIIITKKAKSALEILKKYEGM